jgi:uncharacterized repeat protein (TIGR03803 family)
MFAVAALVLLTATSAWAAGYKVLYNFNSQSSNPSSGLITDEAGNAYGTTSAGGYDGAGTVYELSPKSGFRVLYAFRKNMGGYLPQGNLVFDSNGNLYGTTVVGGTKNAQCVDGCGVVFELSPAGNGQPWTETVLYRFCSQANCADGAYPQAGATFDSAGNLYGTTLIGGNQSCQEDGPGCGTVFELTPTLSGWTENVIHEFTIGDGYFPRGGLTFDTDGNLYGTASGGGGGNGGTVFELSPSGDGWVENVLYNFNNSSGSTDGSGPQAGLIFDSLGNLYGTTAGGGAFGVGGFTGPGTVFELSPDADGWVETILYSFAGGNDGSDPKSRLTLDPSGNLYGTTWAGGGSKGCLGNGCGTVFRLTPTESGQWNESLFRFPLPGTLGLQPTAPVILDVAGSVYGTTTAGGIGDGVVFRIAQ